MLKLAIKETSADRRIAFRGRDFVTVIAERGWSHFHAITPEASIRKPAPARLKFRRMG